MSLKKVYRLQQQGNLLFCRAAVGRDEENPILVRLLVDTGASNTVIPTRILLKLGCNLNNPLQTTTIVTASGVINAPVVLVPWFHCLGVKKGNFSLVALDLPVNSYQLGLLGIDFLRSIKAIIDVSQGQIQLK